MDVQMRTRAMEALIRELDGNLEEAVRDEALRFDYWHLLAVTLVTELGRERAVAAVERTAAGDANYSGFAADFHNYAIEDRMADSLE